MQFKAIAIRANYRLSLRASVSAVVLLGFYETMSPARAQVTVPQSGSPNPAASSGAGNQPGSAGSAVRPKGLSPIRRAQLQSTAAPARAGAAEEVIVTASHRRQSIEATPYNLFVIQGPALQRAGVSDLASLTYQVPGLSTFDVGSRFAGATSPIIRGISADGAPIGNRMAEQSPVATYINNSPSDGYFQLDDVQRVEVLRGAQGTLYGAGSLGGAIRIIPNSAELDTFYGHVDGGGGFVYHGGKASKLTTGFINIPLGHTLALRISGRYSYDPGFIDTAGLLERGNNGVSGIPLLADPTHPVTSPGVFSNAKDWNWQSSITERVDLVWKPTEALNVELASIFSHVEGNGGPEVNKDYPGGGYSNDPRITLPPGSEYQFFSAIEQPFERDSTLSSLDVSYDLGFSTLSSTSSYATTHASTITDDTYGQAIYSFSFPYYSGQPTNPRFVSPFQFNDGSQTFSQEVRIVSKRRVAGFLDYVGGVFYQKQNLDRTWDISAPGSPEYSAAEGCTSPYTSGASFPECAVVAGPGDLTFQGIDHQAFQDISLYGELTAHFLKHGQITFGARHFFQNFTDTQSYSVYTFNSFIPAMPRTSNASKNIFKVNPSYEYALHQFVYAIWSQGFRRGGANAVPTSGPFQEGPGLQSYKPDTTNNFEFGFKGRTFGLQYTADLFDILWDNPQIGGITDAGNYAVWNAKKAQSRGGEFDLSGPLLVRGLTYTIGGAYSDAQLTKDYTIAGGNGAGEVISDAISGSKGSQLPGSPKFSAAATFTYSAQIARNYDLTVSLNNTFKSSIPVLILTAANGGGRSTPDYNMNLSATIFRKAISLEVYAKNLTGSHVELVPHSGPTGTLDDMTTVNRPREVGLRLGVSF